VNLEYEADKSRNNLGYDIEEVAACIRSLTSDEFIKRRTYANEPGKIVKELRYDVYKTKYKPSWASEVDYLYVKFRLTAGPHIWIGSFKLV